MKGRWVKGELFHRFAVNKNFYIIPGHNAQDKGIFCTMVQEVPETEKETPKEYNESPLEFRQIK